jgi:hypothetical protein
MRFPGCEPLLCYHDLELGMAPENSVYKEKLESVVLDSKGPTSFGTSVKATCNSEKGYKPVGLTQTATCTDSCMLEVLPTCVKQKCGDYTALSQEKMIISPIVSAQAGDSYKAECSEGFFAYDYHILPGLESMGPVEVLSYVKFPPPPTFVPKKRSSDEPAVFSLPGLYSMISIQVPPGAWPPNLAAGPSATVFIPSGVSRGMRSDQRIVGPFVSFGPIGVNFSQAITITAAVNLTGIDEGNLEIRVHTYDAGSQTFTPLPYPLGESFYVKRRQGSVKNNRERTSVPADVKIFDAAYVAIASKIPAPVTPAPPVLKKPANDSRTSLNNDEEESVNIMFVILVLAGSFGVTCLLAGTYVARYYSVGFSCCKKKAPSEKKAPSDDQEKDATKNVKADKSAENNTPKPLEPVETVTMTVAADLVIIDTNGDQEKEKEKMKEIEEDGAGTLHEGKDQEVTEKEQKSAPKVGNTVTLVSLDERRRTLNGRQGVVVSFDSKKNFFGVKVDGEAKIFVLKPNHIELQEDHEDNKEKEKENLESEGRTFI